MNNVTQSPVAAQELSKLKIHLIGAISRELETKTISADEREGMVTQLLQQVYQSTRLQLPNTIREQLFHEILNDILGFGILQPLLEDPEISEVMVNGPKKVYIERKGKLIRTNITFENNDEVIKIIEKIIMPLGRRIDNDSPTVDARLPDGSRVNAVIDPVSIDGPTITIRKFMKYKLSMDQLVEFGSISRNMASFLHACVVSRF